MKEKLVLAIVDLLKVKTIITLVMIITACYLAVTKQLDTAVFVGLVTSIITYYFTRSESKPNSIVVDNIGHLGKSEGSETE